jgi:hypothetical protein
MVYLFPPYYIIALLFCKHSSPRCKRGLVELLYLTPIFMVILNLKNSKYLLLLLINVFLSISCYHLKCTKYVTVDWLPMVHVANFNKKELSNAKIYLKRNNAIVDTGYFKKNYKQEDKLFFVGFGFMRVDTFFVQDEIIVNIAHRKFIISEIQQEERLEPKKHCIVVYKINNKTFYREGGILDKDSMEYKGISN